MLVAPTAIVTGVAGQDGLYLAEMLLDCGYQVHGFDSDRGALIKLEESLQGRDDRDDITLCLMDVTDARAVNELVSFVQPDELYNLAAQSRVDKSYECPAITHQSIVHGTANILEAVRISAPHCRVFQASSCEMFGNAPPPQCESTEFQPVSPYASAKVEAHQLVARYRREYEMYVCAGIMFNHESARRSVDFVTRRITDGIARIRAGALDTLSLGNLKSRRDWGNARDYVRAMRLMLQQSDPRDRVIATGKSRSVAEFAELAFSLAGLDWRKHVIHDPDRLRQADPRDFQGDASRIQGIGWKPEIDLEDTIREMLRFDLHNHGVDTQAFADILPRRA